MNVETEYRKRVDAMTATDKVLRSEELFEGRTFPVVARADAAWSKLIWIRHGSHRSRRDLRGLFDGTTEEERERFLRMAVESHLVDLRAEVVAESDEIDVGSRADARPCVPNRVPVGAPASDDPLDPMADSAGR